MRISRKIIVLCCSINGNERETGNIIVTTIYILSRGRLINRIFKRRWNFYRFIFVFFFFLFLSSRPMNEAELYPEATCLSTEEGAKCWHSGTRITPVNVAP